MSFVRGQGVKVSVGIGRDGLIKKIGGIIVTPEEYGKLRINVIQETPIIIQVYGGRYRIKKCRYAYFGPEEGDEKDLIKVLIELQSCVIKEPEFNFPNIGKVNPKLIGGDLIRVVPMSGPTGKIYYYDPIIKSKPDKNKTFKNRKGF